MSRRKVKGQNTAKIKDYTWGQKILCVWVGFLFFLSFSFWATLQKHAMFQRVYEWVEVSIHFVCLFVSCLQAGTCCDSWDVHVHFEPVHTCKIQQGETCWVRQGYWMRQFYSLGWFAHYNTSQDHFNIFFLLSSKLCIQTLWTSDSGWWTETLICSPHWLRVEREQKKSYTNLN